MSNMRNRFCIIMQNFALCDVRDVVDNRGECDASDDRYDDEYNDTHDNIEDNVEDRFETAIFAQKRVFSDVAIDVTDDDRTAIEEMTEKKIDSEMQLLIFLHDFSKTFSIVCF